MIRVGAELCRTVDRQEQDWAPLVYMLCKKKKKKKKKKNNNNNNNNNNNIGGIFADTDISATGSYRPIKSAKPYIGRALQFTIFFCIS